MAVCQKCGKENSPGSAVCADCGTALSGERKPNLAGTMLGMPSPVGKDATTSPRPGGPHDEPAPPPPQGQNKKAFAGTMMGMPSPLAVNTRSPAHSPAEASATGPEATKKKAFAGTMMGMPSPVLPPGRPAQSPPHAESPPRPPATQAAPLGKTMVGMGAPVGLGSASKASSEPALPGHGQLSPAPAAVPQNKKFQGTLLGVAQPGIAPSPEGRAKAPPSAAPTPAASESSGGASQSFATEPTELPFPTTRPSWKTGLMIGGGMALAAAIGGGVALLAPKPVTVVVEKFSIDDDGNDQLELACEECPDGSELILGEATARIDNKRAVLTPRAPLSLGRNELEFTLKVQDELRDVKKVILPIAFRVLTKWTGLHESPPFGLITVAAPEGSSLSIDGKSVPVQGEMGEYRVEFSKETTGESPKVAQVSSKHDIVVTVDDSARETQAILQNGVTPLSLSSPSSVHQLGGKPVAVSGRTSAGATVMIGDEKVVADDKGSFSHVIESPEPGDLRVAAHSEKFLTRQVTVSLTKEASTPDGAVTKFSDLTPGVTASLRANVIESRTAGGTTQALLEVESGCEAPPCLLRAVYAEPKKLSPNRSVQLIGDVAGGSPLTVKVTRFR